MRTLVVSTLILSVFLSACSKPAEEPVVVVKETAAEVAAPVVEPKVAVDVVEPVENAHASHNHEAAPAVQPVKEVSSPVVESKPVVTSAFVAPDQFIAGTHYEKLPIAVKTITGNKIEVTEVFSYACIHCYHFEKVAKSWVATMPEGVEFVQNPAIFNKAWAYYARIYYTAKALKVLDPVHDQVFESIHVKGNRLGDVEDVAAIFAAAGIENDKFNSTFESFGVSSQVQQADTRVSKGFKTQGTPELIIDGRYRVTTAMAGNHPNMFKVVNFLIAKIKDEKSNG
ncbi:thiol:disulfide interchange protein DsbA/DsbL [Teredinibacter purpureus]|uniref:thiol:disulfide interchange protein DsbA/DsbL n=1 Tax=Teredinibacter purpureus TaxID=2731756 RepID=UPI000698C8E5|nr:thiol:disulfide interchange protein DsbA/DsbL [Teredinibacter purpureus]